jgi:hypothetical protein
VKVVAPLDLAKLVGEKVANIFIRLKVMVEFRTREG